MSATEMAILQVAIAIVNALLVVGGWVVVHKFTVKREQRKRKQEAFESFCEKLDEITTLARKFHMAKEHNAEEAETLRCSLARLPRYAKRAGALEQVFSHHLTAFRQAITRSNFESPSLFQSQNVASAVLREIDDAGSALEIAVEQVCSESRQSTI